MEVNSQFQGMAGQVIRQFIKLNGFVVYAQILVYWLVLLYLVYLFMPNLSGYPLFILQLLAASFLLARFALAAKDGDFNSGLLNSNVSMQDSFHYAIRYIVYTLYWLVPVVIINKLLSNDSAMLNIFSAASGASTNRLGGMGVILLLLLLVQIFAPVISALLANLTDSYKDLISPEPFRIVFQDRLHELSSYFAAIIGGLVVFYAKYLIAFFIINFIAFQISFDAGMITSKITYLLPYYIAPVLIGRLSGAFIIGEEDLEHQTEPLATEELQNNKCRQLYLNTLEKLPHMSIEKTNKSIHSLLKENQDNIYIQLLLSHLYWHKKDKKAALDKADIALKRALKEGLSIEAANLFQAFADEREAFHLDKDDYVLLAKFLMLEQHFMEAAWCYLKALKEVENDSDEQLIIQKKYLSVADEAQKALANKQAYTLYDLFIKNFPNSSLSAFAMEQRKSLAGKIND